MIRVLHAVTYMGRGGLETMLMNYYRKIDRSKVQFDFLVHRDFEADYDKEIKELGGRIYSLPRLNPVSGGYLHALREFFENHGEYRIIHSHLDCMSGVVLKCAEKHGVPVRIAHAHSSSQDKNIKYLLKLFYKRNIPKYATRLFACSKAAGDWMFSGAEYTVINNAVDSQLYSYSEHMRKNARASLSIDENSFVIGHVGRFSEVKNHSFILDIFGEVLKKRPAAKLLLVGDGELRDSIEERALQMGLKDSVVFAGSRSDVPKLLSAMDVFLFPSHFEGLPLSVVEAQASGLPCFISDKVSRECSVSGLVSFISLERGAAFWAEQILNADISHRMSAAAEIEEAGFDICKNARALEKFYISAYKNAENGK